MGSGHITEGRHFEVVPLRKLANIGFGYITGGRHHNFNPVLLQNTLSLDSQYNENSIQHFFEKYRRIWAKLYNSVILAE